MTEVVFPLLAQFDELTQLQKWYVLNVEIDHSTDAYTLHRPLAQLSYESQSSIDSELDIRVFPLDNQRSER